ncbi:MAG: hypothetical protein ACYDIE_10110 [Candidatus Krumholzibacteriia bacterium]
MVRREFWIPLAVLALTVAFALVSWLVRLSRGNAWLIRRKLRLGALLLGLTWSAAGCDGADGGGIVTCYLPAPVDDVSFDAPFQDATGLVLDLAQGSEMTGALVGRTSSAYAFQVMAGDAEIQRGDLVATDGVFDEEAETFRVVLAPAGLPAEGILRLYRGPADAVPTLPKIFEAPLTVVAAP